MTVLFAFIAGLGGLLVGGLINALADDLPARHNPRLPHYPDGTARRPSAWLGLAAFLTGQRQSETGSRLHWRHPAVEIVMALAFAGLVLRFHDEQNLPALFVFVAIMMLVTVIDLEHRLILFVVIIPSCLFALVAAAVWPYRDRAFTDFLWGGLLGFGTFFLLFLGGLAYSALKHMDEIAFGFGDVMLAALSGLILGWQAMMFAMWITVFAAGAGAILYVVARLILRRRVFAPFPYGPYIVFGTLALLLFREEVQHFLWSGAY